MNTNDIKQLASPCGVFCAACSEYREGGKCRACRSDPRHNACDIYECCVTLGGKEFCFECDCFPCERLKEFVNSNPGKRHAHYRHVAIENLERIRNDGMEQWFRDISRETRDGTYQIDCRDSEGRPDGSPCSCVSRGRVS